MTESQVLFTAVYGPVQSWRFGRSLGIDPIGAVSTCSFNCVYCQLGEIEQITCDRRVFVPTEPILQELEAFAPWAVDIITFSGSGEPTLALNLGELIQSVQRMTQRPVAVLTNGTLLSNPAVQEALAPSDCIAVKVDAVGADRWRRINRPAPELSLDNFWTDLQQFRQRYTGILAIQTMLLSPWEESEQVEYIQRLQELRPDEIQLNTPTRPKPIMHQLEARGNHEPGDPLYPVLWLKPVSADVMHQLGDRIQSETGILVRYPPAILSAP